MCDGCPSALANILGVARRNRIKKTPPRGRSAGERLGAWSSSKRPVLVFGLKFASVLAALYTLSLAPFWTRIQDGYLQTLARLANGLLSGFGENSQLTGATIWSGKYGVTVTPECAGLQFGWFLAAAMVAFPAAWGRRALGFVIGVALLGVLNVVRVGSLYFVGVHAPSAFASMHEDVWPSILVLATVGMMAAWIGWAQRAEPSKDEGAK